jgi:ATP-dependent helicase/nuclease subunit A
MPLYEAAMRRRDIPCYPLLSDGFYGRSEITDIIVALEAVRDPTDDRALLGFLRGPFVGVSDETLLRIAMQIRTPYWRKIREVDAPEADVLRRGVALLDRYSLLRDRVPVASLVEGLLQESGYLAHLALLGDDGQQAIANVRRFLDLARAAQETTLGEVLRRIGEERARGDRVPQARLHGEKDDVVLVTSVHSAKGLEWHAVFWGDLGRQPVADWDNGLRLGRETLVVGDPDRKYSEQDEAWTALYEREQEERRAEAKRTWYVAATRARDLLVLSGLPLGEKPRVKGSPAEMLLGALPGLGNAVQLTYSGDDGQTHVARVRRLDDAVAQAEAALHAPVVVGPVGDPAALPAPLSPVLAPLGRGRHSATELMVFQRCPRRHWLRYIAGIREPALALGGPTWKSAAVKGTVVHDVLEHLREEEDADALLEDAIERHAPDAPAEDAPEGSRYRSALRREIARVAENPEYRALADHPHARRELPFLFILGEGRYAEGFFDLAAPGAEGLRILDVKTGDTPVAEAVEKYAPQRDVYTSAASAIAGMPVAEFLFAFSRTGQLSDAPLPSGGVDAARERVLEAVGKIEAGERALRPDVAACEWCPYRKVGVCPGAAEP